MLTILHAAITTSLRRKGTGEGEGGFSAREQIDSIYSAFPVFQQLSEIGEAYRRKQVHGLVYLVSLNEEWLHVGIGT